MKGMFLGFTLEGKDPLEIRHKRVFFELGSAGQN